MADAIVGAIFAGFLTSLGWLPVLVVVTFLLRNQGWQR